MTARITVGLIDALKDTVRDLLAGAARRLPHLHYADVRLEIVEGKSAAAENGAGAFVTRTSYEPWGRSSMVH